MTTLDYRRDRAGGVNGAAQVNGTRRRAFAWWVWDKSHPIGTPPMVRRIERAIG